MHQSVRAFTMLDVVASTSLQFGLLVSGFLITASGPPEPTALRQARP
ncbi:MAG: hypothetical protein R2715_25140 [Ilumatobacteraceae bacterium]